jgi:hypothetical protein
LHDEDEHEGSFAEGQSEEHHTEEAEHQGSFAEGHEDEEEKD